MNPKSYRTPTTPETARVRCPVCHEAVYSRAGIHPQCAVRQSDPPKSKAKVTVVIAPTVPAEVAADPAEAAVGFDPPALDGNPAPV